MGTERDFKKQRVWQDIKPLRPQPKSVSKTATKKINFKNTLSRIYNKIKKILPKFSKKRTMIFISIVIISVISILCYFSLTSQSTKKIGAGDTVQTINTTPTLTKGTPGYSTVLPGDKKIDDLGGWTRVSPTTTDPVFAYVDKIENVSVNVSEQPLPDDFKTDTENNIEQLAQGFKASEKITIGSTIIHIGTSAEGPQSAIFSLKGLLILIKSSTKINNDQWAKYISSMK